MTWKYSLEAGELVVQNETTGTIDWKGRPEGCSVTKIIPIGNECVVLLDPSSGPNWLSNLVMCRADGSVVWRAKLPSATGRDLFTWAELTEKGLQAFAWSGFTISVEVETGHTITTEFTK